MTYRQKSALRTSSVLTYLIRSGNLRICFCLLLKEERLPPYPIKKVKVSKDKMMLVSRLIYTVGYDGKRYNEEYDSEGNKNRMLSNLLRRYKNEKFPSVIANNYNVVS